VWENSVGKIVRGKQCGGKTVWGENSVGGKQCGGKTVWGGNSVGENSVKNVYRIYIYRGKMED
jgi:hypothetical protein